MKNKVMQKALSWTLSVAMAATMSGAIPAMSVYAADTATSTDVYYAQLAGDGRYDTAASIAEQWFKAGNTSTTAVLVYGGNFPDALSASGLAGVLKAPLLMTDTASLSTQTQKVITDHKITNIYIVGGEGVVSKAVADALEKLGCKTTRVSGDDRQQTAEQVEAKILEKGGSTDTVFVATGNSAADAISASAWAYKMGAPMVLADANGNLTSASLAIAKAAKQVYVLGGEGAVNKATYDSITSAKKRLAGEGRYDTSKAIATEFAATGVEGTGFASGSDAHYSDALAGGCLMGSKGAPILLVDGTTGAGFDYAKSVLANKTSTIAFLGGTGAVPTTTSGAITSLWGGKATQTTNYEETGTATLTASQKGASIIEAVSSIALTSADKIEVKKGSTVQDVKTVLSEDGKTITIASSTKLTAGDYTITVTPADTAKAPFEAKVTAEAEKLSGINFGKELVLVNNTNFYTVQTSLTGANQFGEDFDLGSGTVQVYPSVSKAADASANGMINTKQYYCGYDSKTKTYTLVKDGTIPFQIGDSVTLTAIYTNGSTVVQSNATLKVSNAAYVSEMTFGDLSTTNAKLKDKKVTVKNFNGGTYYIPVVAKDQYGNTLTADQLNTAISGSTLFINPIATQGAYGGFDTSENFTKLDDGTIAMNLDGGASGSSLPGEATITVAGLGGLSTSVKYTVVDNPYIDTMNVTFDSSIYAKEAAAFSVTATDQYGDAYSLYDADITLADSNKTIAFGDANTMTKQGSKIQVNNGVLAFSKKSSDKSVSFTYTANDGVTNDVATITTATPKVTTQTLTVGKTGVPAGIQKTLDSTKTNSNLNITSAQHVDFSTGLVFTDSNGQVIKTGNSAGIEVPTFAAADIAYADGKITAGTAVSTTNFATADVTHYYYSVYSSATKALVNPVNSVNAAGTYTVTLYSVTSPSAATLPAKAKVVASQDFKVVVSSTNTTGNKYESYEVSVKAGDELLLNAINSTMTSATVSTPLAQTDSATIQVKGTDANGKTVNLDVTSDYTLTVNKGLNVSGTTITPAANSVIEGGVVYDDVNNTHNQAKVEGTATVTVWDTQSGQEVGSVELKYSNAAKTATSWSWKKVVDANANGTIDAGETVSDADESVDVTATAAAGLASNTSGVLTIKDDTDGRGAYDAGEYLYVLKALDQYGLDMTNTTFDMNGAVFNAANYVNKPVKTTYTIKANCGSLATKTVKIVRPSLGGAAAFAVTAVAVPTYNATDKTLTCGATSPAAATVSYQWYKDNKAIENATSKTYTATAAGTYTVKVTGTGDYTGTATSDAYVVTATATNIVGAGAAAVTMTNPGSTAMTGVTVTDQFGNLMKSVNSIPVTYFAAGAMTDVTGVTLSTNADGVLVVTTTGTASADGSCTATVLGKTLTLTTSSSHTELAVTSWA